LNPRWRFQNSDEDEGKEESSGKNEVKSPRPRLCEAGFLEEVGDLQEAQLKGFSPCGDNVVKDDEPMDDEGSSFQRYTAILRVNRQIYLEASNLFYSKLTMILSPGDVISVNPTSQGIIQRTKNLWRYHPESTWRLDKSNGKTHYKTPPMNGAMEPHVSARIRKILLDIDFDMLSFEPAPIEYLRNDPQMYFKPKSDFVELITYSAFIQDFSKIISQSHIIDHLHVHFDIDIAIEYDKWETDNEGSLRRIEPSKVLDNMAIANQRTLETLPENEILAPLAKLTNIKSFTFALGGGLNREGDPYQMLSRHADKVHSLRSTIEGNWLPVSGIRWPGIGHREAA